MRKVYVHSGYIDERIYLGGYEIWRRHESGSLKEERETLHVADDARRVCMIETLTVENGSAPSPITSRYRFQLDNHLGTVAVETDDAGAVISYEEYHPYGTSAYRAMKSGVEVSAKRYRYVGKEKDEETKLYLMGARYYAAWLARWTAADPAGTVDGTNLYAYVRGSPVGLVDPSGTQAVQTDHPEPDNWVERPHIIWLNPVNIEGELPEGGSSEHPLQGGTSERLGSGDLSQGPAEPGAKQVLLEAGTTKVPQEHLAKGAGEAEPEPSPSQRPRRRTQIGVPHFEGLEGSALPQVQSFPDTGSAFGNALNYTLGWIYNWEAAIISGALATVEGTDKALVRQLRGAGLSSYDIQAIQDVGMLHSAELSLALRSGTVALRQFADDVRASRTVLGKATPGLIAGLPVTPITTRSQRWWPRISAVSSDWATKGAHVHVNGVELAVRPAANGEIVFRPVFSGYSSAAVRSATNTARRALAAPGFRQRLFNASSRAIRAIEGGKQAELRFLMHALQKLGL